MCAHACVFMTYVFMAYIFVLNRMLIFFPPCSYKFINKHATEMKAGQGGWTGLCLRPRTRAGSWGLLCLE